MKTLIKNGTIVTMNSNSDIFPGGYLTFEGNVITAAGPAGDTPADGNFERVIDAGGKIVMPGLTNTHMHLYSTFARGMALKDEPPANFVQILERLWWRLDKALTEEDIYFSAMIALIDCIKCGTTAIIDHHASPNAIPGSLDTISRAVEETGIRSCLCYEVSDRDGEKRKQQGIEENVRFIKKAAEMKNPLLAGTFGLHASFTVGDETLKECADLARSLGTGFHVHCAEDRADQENSVEKYGLRVVERYSEFGILGENTILVHCVHLNDNEMKLIRDSATNVVHNPESNMGNAVGCADVLKMVEMGINVGLGTDGFTSDMFKELGVFNILHKFNQRDPRVGYRELPVILFNNNKRLLAKFFSRPLCVLQPGAFADIIMLDYHPPTPFNSGTLLGHLIFGLSSRHVDTTIVDGRVLMEGRKLVNIDEAKVAEESRKLAEKMWARL